METQVVQFRTVPFHRYFTMTSAGLFPLRRDGSSSSGSFSLALKGPLLAPVRERKIRQNEWGTLEWHERRLLNAETLGTPARGGGSWLGDHGFA